jgi:hypothetical protein
MRKLVNIEEIQGRIAKAHGESVHIDTSTYCGVNKKAKFIDSEYGEWWATPKNVCHGYGHRVRGYIKRSMPSKLSVQQIENRLLDMYGKQVSLLRHTYVDTHTKATFKDEQFGEWSATPNSVLAGHLNYKRGSINRQKTNRSRYGVPFVSQDRKIALKQSRSGNRGLSWRYKWGN